MQSVSDVDLTFYFSESDPVEHLFPDLPISTFLTNIDTKGVGKIGLVTLICFI